MQPSASDHIEKQSPGEGAGTFDVVPGTIIPRPPIENSPKNHQPFAAPADRTSENSLGSSNHPAFTGSPTKHFPDVQKMVPPPIGIIIGKGEYHPGYCDMMVAYFDRPKKTRILDSYVWKSGAVSEKERYVPTTPPHFSEFARKIGVTTRTLRRWASEHPEFKESYDTCQEIFEEFLIDNGLTGEYGAIAMKFVAVNRTKMKDKVVQENQTLNLNKVLDKIAAGEVKPGGAMLLETNEDY